MTDDAAPRAFEGVDGGRVVSVENEDGVTSGRDHERRERASRTALAHPSGVREGEGR